MPTNRSNMLQALAMAQLLGAGGAGVGNRNNNLTSLLARRRKVPAETNFYNSLLRRFFYSNNGGFYVIVGLNRNGQPIRRRVPGQFVYQYNKKLGRIVPYTVGGQRRSVRRRRL